MKVLTKTMEKQGADIANIAKVQYAVCVQAGIYIPDEFVRDVAVTLDMKEIGESKVFIKFLKQDRHRFGFGGLVWRVK